MFEKFTDEARRVIVLAQEEARLLNHNYIGTEHVLLGLIREGGGVAAQALQFLGIALERVRSQVEEVVKPGQQTPSGHVPFTPRAKKVLELSHRESLALGHDYIGTEHILLALIRVSEGVGAQVLVKLAVDLNRVRQKVLQLIGGHVARRASVARADPRPMEPRLAGQILPLLGVIHARLAALERRVGTGAGTGDLDRRIERLHEEMEEAARSQKYERAAELRDKEKQLFDQKAAREQEWEAAHPNLSELAETCRQLRDEVNQLRSLLHQHGIDPQDRPAGYESSESG